MSMETIIRDMARSARDASVKLAACPSEKKKAALYKIAEIIEKEAQSDGGNSTSDRERKPLESAPGRCLSIVGSLSPRKKAQFS